MNGEALQLIVGHNIRVRRRTMKLKQHEVAHLLGCDQTAVSLLERGLRWPSADMLAALCDVLCVRGAWELLIPL